jgi:hypothetical protein
VWGFIYVVLDVLKQCTLSPPPALDPSTRKVTKLPAGIKNLKKMLQQGVDTEDEHPDSRETTTKPQQVFGRNLSKNDLKEVDIQNKSHDARQARDSFHRADLPTDDHVEKNERRREGSQKENSAKLKRRSVSAGLSTQKTQNDSKPGLNVKKKVGAAEGVLTEQRLNTGQKQRTLTSMLGSGSNLEAPKESRAVDSSVCFVITRLPKQFVVS